MRLKAPDTASRSVALIAAAACAALLCLPGCASRAPAAKDPSASRSAVAAEDTAAKGRAAGRLNDAAPANEMNGITGLSALALRDRIARRELTARAVTEAFLARIAAVDDAGPGLNAVIELNPEALAIADALDRSQALGVPTGPLHGVPVLLKANIDTGDRMATSAGSLALADNHARLDAYLVARLRGAGAIILGKTNLSEWANFRSSSSSSGWSSIGGQTRNPYVLDRNPCGSSSGSGAAAAAALAPLTVGTETDGSIVCPSSVNGVVGIKPTVGTVSRQGIIPISHTQDTAGPMARSVTDAALLLQSMIGYDENDPAPRRYPQGDPDLLPDPQGTRLDGIRIGVFRSYFGAGQFPRAEAVYTRAIETLRSLGAEIIDPIEYLPAPETRAAEYNVMLYEFKAGLNAYLAAHEVAADRDTLAELIAWNQANAQQVMPIFGQEVFVEADARGGLDDPEYLQALETGPQRVRADLQALLDGQQLDALISLTTGPAWKTDWVSGDWYQMGGAYLAAMSGYPSIAVPAGDIEGLPIGISFIGPAFSEPSLIQTAYAFEQAAAARAEPRFLPTLERIGTGNGRAAVQRRLRLTPGLRPRE
ncbi:MAG: amidase [Pseudomonadales bacterium]